MMFETPTTIRAARAVQALRQVDALERRLDGEHLPRRPEWDCRTCDRGTAWPCSPARVRLAEAYKGNRVNLAMYLGSLLFVATAELTSTSTVDLYERFIAWTK